MNDNLINIFNHQIEDLNSSYSLLTINDIIFTAIKIINHLCNEKSTSLKIALDLGFILHKPKKQNLNIEIHEKLKHLPGFSRLLMNVLEDFELKNNIDEFFNGFSHQSHIYLKNTLKYLDRYEDIKAILEDSYPVVPVIIFLHGCQKILGKENVLKWLVWRKQKSYIIDLFTLFIKSKLDEIEQVEILLSYLCIYADEGLIFGEKLDEIVNHFNLESLYQLREAEWF